MRCVRVRAAGCNNYYFALAILRMLSTLIGAVIGMLSVSFSSVAAYPLTLNCGLLTAVMWWWQSERLSRPHSGGGNALRMFMGMRPRFLL